jgi:hypothetical protein
MKRRESKKLKKEKEMPKEKSIKKPEPIKSKPELHGITHAVKNVIVDPNTNIIKEAR